MFSTLSSLTVLRDRLSSFAWAVALLTIAWHSVWEEANAQIFFGERAAAVFDADGIEEEEDEPEANWTIEEMQAIARDMLDENWENRLKYYRLVARTRLDEVRNTCQLSEAQLHKLTVAAEGQAFKSALEERAEREENIDDGLRSYHRQGTSKAQVRAMIGNYANQRVYYSYRNNNSPGLLWSQALSNILNDEQAKKLRERTEQRQARLKQLFLDRMVAQMDLFLRLTPQQEKQLRSMFDPMLGEGRIQVGPNSFMHVDEFNMLDMNIWSLMRGTKAKDMQKLLTESQWELWKSVMQERTGGWGFIDEVMVLEEGVEEEEDAEADAEEGEGAKAAADDAGAAEEAKEAEDAKEDEKKDPGGREAADAGKQAAGDGEQQDRKATGNEHGR